MSFSGVLDVAPQACGLSPGPSLIGAALGTMRQVAADGGELSIGVKLPIEQLIPRSWKNPCRRDGPVTIGDESRRRTLSVSMAARASSGCWLLRHLNNPIMSHPKLEMPSVP
jgi:hypothetical protein